MLKQKTQETKDNTPLRMQSIYKQVFSGRCNDWLSFNDRFV